VDPVDSAVDSPELSWRVDGLDEEVENVTLEVSSEAPEEKETGMGEVNFASRLSMKLYAIHIVSNFSFTFILHKSKE